MNTRDMTCKTVAEYLTSIGSANADRWKRYSVMVEQGRIFAILDDLKHYVTDSDFPVQLQIVCNTLEEVNKR